MSAAPPLEINHFTPQKRQLILPQEPLVSALDLGWKHFSFDYYQYENFDALVHVHDHHVIAFVVNQVQTHRRLDGKFCQEQQNFGSVSIIPANVAHWVCCKTEIKFVIFSIPPQSLAAIAPETINPDRIELIPHFAPSEPDHVVAGIGMGLKQQLEIDPQGCDLYAQHLKNALFAHLLQNYCSIQHHFPQYSDGLSANKLKRAIDYINDNLDQTIKLTDIASLLEMSQYHFCRLFRQSTGISPYRYTIRQRVYKAKRLIKTSSMSLSTIALESGFSSQSQMTHHFRKFVGFTPKRYRDSL